MCFFPILTCIVYDIHRGTRVDVIHPEFETPSVDKRESSRRFNTKMQKWTSMLHEFDQFDNTNDLASTLKPSNPNYHSPRCKSQSKTKQTQASKSESPLKKSTTRHTKCSQDKLVSQKQAIDTLTTVMNNVLCQNSDKTNLDVVCQEILHRYTQRLENCQQE